MTAEQWVNNQFSKQMINEDIYASKEGIIESHRQFALLEKQQGKMYSEEEVKFIVSEALKAMDMSAYKNPILSGAATHSLAVNTTIE